MRIVLIGRTASSRPRGGGEMCIVFSGRARSVLRKRGNGLNLIVLNGLSLFIAGSFREYAFHHSSLASVFCPLKGIMRSFRQSSISRQHTKSVAAS